MPYQALFGFRSQATLSEGLLDSKLPFNIMQIFLMQKDIRETLHLNIISVALHMTLIHFADAFNQSN